MLSPPVNTATFPDDIAALKQIIADRDALISQLEERNRLLQAILYGSKSESNFSFTGTDEIDKELESIPGIKDSTKAIAQFNKAEKEAQKLYAQIPYENGQITVAVKKGLANYGPAGYSSGARVMVTAHPENLGWEK